MSTGQQSTEDRLRDQLSAAADLLHPRVPGLAELPVVTPPHRSGTRLRRATRWFAPPLLVAATVTAIAFAVTAANGHNTSPNRSVAQSPSPTSAVPTPIPSTSTKSTTPASPTNRPPASSSSVPPGSSRSEPSQDLSGPYGYLLTSRYGFLVPSDFHEHPLDNGGGPLSWASFTQAASAPTDSPKGVEPLSVQYEVSGGELGIIYSHGGKPSITGALAMAACPPTSWQATSDHSLTYTCAPVDGMTPRGAVTILPLPQGWKGLLVTLPDSQRATAEQILASLPGS